MATTTAAPASTSARASHVRGAVMVSFYDGTHKVHSAFAHVLAEGPVDDNGNPSLSVAYPDPHAHLSVLSGPNWWKGYRRHTGVKHVDHEDVKAGKESIAWGGIIATPQALAGEGPTIPQPEGDATRPYLKREVPKEAAAVSVNQSAAVQTNSTPQPSATSPAVNEPPSTPADGGTDAPTGPDATPGGNTGTAE